MAKLGDLIVNIGANTRDLNRKLGGVQRKMRSMTSNFKKLGRGMSRSLSLPLAAVGAASLKIAVDFEASMAKVKAVSGATAGEFKTLEDAAKRLGRTTVFTASEVAGLQLEFAKLGFSSEEINQVTEATLNLAQATGSDLSQAAAVAGATLGGFGLDASETGRITDVMAASFNSSALDINKFQDSMKFVAPVAKAAGISLEETTAMLGVLASAGIKGSQAGTALRRIFSEMGDTGGDLTKTLADLSEKGLNLADAKDEVGRHAQSALLVLANGVPTIKKFTTELENSGGAAEATADIMNDTAAGAMKRMTSALEGAAIIIGDALTPMLNTVASVVTKLATKFSSLEKSTQSTVLIVAGLLAVLGPLLIILPQIAAAFTIVRTAMVVLQAAMLTNPIYLVATAIAVLGIAMVAFGGDIKNSREETDKFIESLIGLDKQAQINEINAEIRKKKAELKSAEKSLSMSEQLARSGDKFDRQAGNQSVQRYTGIIDGLTGSIGDLEQALIDVNKVEFKIPDLSSESSSESKSGKGIIIVRPEQMELLEKLPPKLIAIDEPMKQLGKSTETVIESVTLLTDNMIQMASIVGEGLGNLVNGAKDVKNSMLDMAKSAIRAVIAMAKANVIANATNPLNPANLASGGLAAPFLALAGLTALDQMVANIPALAEGGLAFGPTLAMVGDNKNASADPEVIAPLSKLKDMLGGGSIQVYGRISGDDIVLSNSSAARHRNRF